MDSSSHLCGGTLVVLTPTDELPLHDRTQAVMDESQWWFCEFPERPSDEDACIDWRCPKCLIKAKTEVAMGNNYSNFGMRHDSTGYGLGFSLSEGIRAVEAQLVGDEDA
jgi:hypothetical protein